ncbi:hypothetical protein L211DRAFT_847210 [Terfezia boudieri ATCC MYA-4762]|uniref:Uncharacterized protein n=1 Tax=Terfezia boudieri ATCC MYA-4762 TaxID=1051890 RepID=A0A3N4LUI8_9PEZI|nr:hypothetical protein L211DRAFT_847210 [Terfezia boudieri ATCC MYA-4762]
MPDEHILPILRSIPPGPRSQRLPWSTFSEASSPKIPSAWGLWPTASSKDTSTSPLSFPTTDDRDPKMVFPSGKSGAFSLPAIIGIVMRELQYYWAYWRWRALEAGNVEPGHPRTGEGKRLWPPAWYRPRQPDTESAGHAYPGGSKATRTFTSRGSLASSSTWGAEKILAPDYTGPSHSHPAPCIDPSLYKVHAEQNHNHSSKKSQTVVPTPSA